MNIKTILSTVAMVALFSGNALAVELNSSLSTNTGVSVGAPTSVLGDTSANARVQTRSENAARAQSRYDRNYNGNSWEMDNKYSNRTQMDLNNSAEQNVRTNTQLNNDMDANLTPRRIDPSVSRRDKGGESTYLGARSRAKASSGFNN